MPDKMHEFWKAVEGSNNATARSMEVLHIELRVRNEHSEAVVRSFKKNGFTLKDAYYSMEESGKQVLVFVS